MKKSKIIGFDRKIELEWIDYTVKLILNGLSESEIRKKLAKHLSIYGLGSATDGAARKTITVLARLWLNVSDDLLPLRDEALDLYKVANDSEKVTLHICLAMTSYPFFFDVLTQIGRLLKLQGKFSSNQITRRIIEKWGDTQRVKRSVRHVLLTLKLWNVIEPLKNTSLYRSTTNSYDPSKKMQLFIKKSLQFRLGCKCLVEEYNSHPAMYFCRRKI